MADAVAEGLLERSGANKTEGEAAEQPMAAWAQHVAGVFDDHGLQAQAQAQAQAKGGQLGFTGELQGADLAIDNK